jgi:predicted O-methyltransferase YrrM
MDADDAMLDQSAIETAVGLAGHVDGWLTPREAGLLYSLAQSCPQDLAIVELGSFRGRSTICLAAGSKAGNGPPVYAIDPHCDGTREEFLRNLEEAGVDDVVRPVVSTSEEANSDWHRSIGLLFIDANHEYEEVKKDYLLWSPFVAEGAVIALHDSTAKLSYRLSGYVGPRRVVREFILGSSMYSDLGLTDTITYAVRRRPDLGDRLSALAFRARKLVPDLLLLTNAYVLPRMPQRLVAGLLRAGTGKEGQQNSFQEEETSRT